MYVHATSRCSLTETGQGAVIDRVIKHLAILLVESLVPHGGVRARSAIFITWFNLTDCIDRRQMTRFYIRSRRKSEQKEPWRQDYFEVPLLVTEPDPRSVCARASLLFENKATTIENEDRIMCSRCYVLRNIRMSTLMKKSDFFLSLHRVVSKSFFLQDLIS